MLIRFQSMRHLWSHWWVSSSPYGVRNSWIHMASATYVHRMDFWRLFVYTLYGDSLSGNCYKVQLLMNHLGIEFDWQHINILGNGTHTSEFLAMNPVGKIPLLKLPDGRYLSESNAILNYLAEGLIIFLMTLGSEPKCCSGSFLSSTVMNLFYRAVASSSSS